VFPLDTGFISNGFPAALVIAALTMETVNTAPSATDNELTDAFFDMFYTLLWCGYWIANYHAKIIAKASEEINLESYPFPV
jgi:hypothetical protein